MNKDFSDAIINDVLADKFKTLAVKLSKEIKVIGDKKFIHKDLEMEGFRLLAENKGYIHDPQNFTIANAVSAPLRDISENVIAGDSTGLKAGQTTCNAGSDECNIVRTYPQFAFAGGGEIDHQYHHSGKGFQGADLVLKSDFSFTYEDPVTKEIKTGILKAGWKVDAKAYWSLTDDPENEEHKGAITRLNNNMNGELGHGEAQALFIRIITEDHGTAWYYSPNKPGFTPLKMLDFKPDLYYHHVQLSIAPDGILDVKFVD